MIPGEWERGRWTEVREVSEEVTFEVGLKGLIGRQQVENEYKERRDQAKLEGHLSTCTVSKQNSAESVQARRSVAGMRPTSLEADFKGPGVYLMITTNLFFV